MLVCYFIWNSQNWFTKYSLCSFTTFSPFTVPHPHGMWEQHRTCHLSWQLIIVPLLEMSLLCRVWSSNDLLKFKWFTNWRWIPNYRLTNESFFAFNVMFTLVQQTIIIVFCASKICPTCMGLHTTNQYKPDPDPYKLC